MFTILSLVFKYLFIIIIYFFIYTIIKLIYLDMRGLSFITSGNESYIELLNDVDTISYLIKEYYVLNRKISFGRGINNEVILGDPYISKHHAEIVNRDGEFVLRDLNSSNGTYLNDKQILGEVELKSGDIIGLGDLQFKFKKK